jgi:hypothetical protein
MFDEAVVDHSPAPPPALIAAQGGIFPVYERSEYLRH